MDKKEKKYLKKLVNKESLKIIKQVKQELNQQDDELTMLESMQKFFNDKMYADFFLYTLSFISLFATSLILKAITIIAEAGFLSLKTNIIFTIIALFALILFAYIVMYVQHNLIKKKKRPRRMVNAIIILEFVISMNVLFPGLMGLVEIIVGL